MTIIISDNDTKYEYYDVPRKVGNAVKTLLDECGNVDSCIVTAESDADFPQAKDIEPTVKGFNKTMEDIPMEYFESGGC